MVRRLINLRLLVLVAVLCNSVLARAQAPGVAWRTDLDNAKIEAARTGKLLLVHFTSAACYPCKVLDQNVLSQPQVGTAVERDYVPVRIDADAQRALASAFRVETVPTEVVLTPQGNVVATLSSSTPETPEAYITQLENLARHFRQTTGQAGAAGAQTYINSAYAALPANAVGNTGLTNRYAPPQPSAGAAPPVAQQQTNPHYQQLAAASTAAPPVVAPATAMPQSYRNVVTSTPGAAAGASAAAAGAGLAAAAPNAAGIAPAPSMPSAAAVSAATPAIAATQPPLPGDCPLVVFDGCCPVSLKMFNKWTPGSTAFGAIHRGRTYLFVGDAERQQFLADPDAYSPVFAGYDPVLLLDQRQTVPGSRKFGYRYGGSFYLFASKETMSRFEASPQTYAAGVRQAMHRIDAAAGGVFRR